MLGRERSDAAKLRAELIPWSLPAGMDYIPGFQPGGPMEQISRMSGSQFIPRGREMTIPIDPSEGVNTLQAELARLAQIHPGNFGAAPPSLPPPPANPLDRMTGFGG
jgi:hypothetical protein